jgi:lauroyl/myristoyl acyltransferase
MRERWLEAAACLVDVAGDLPFSLAGRTSGWVADCLAEIHPDRGEFLRLTRQGIAERLPGAPAEQLAAEVFRNYLITQYVDKLQVKKFLTGEPFAWREIGDSSELRAAMPRGGAIVCSCHFAHYALLPALLNGQGIDVVFLRGRADVLGKLEKHKGDIIYSSDPTAPFRLLKALSGGRAVFMMIDQIDPKGITATLQLLGQPAHAQLGIGWLAERAKCPLITMSLEQRPDGLLRIKPLAEVSPAGRKTEETLQEVFSSLEAPIAERPESWLNWYIAGCGKEGPQLRSTLKTSNDALWKGLTEWEPAGPPALRSAAGGA